MSLLDVYTGHCRSIYFYRVCESHVYCSRPLSLQVMELVAVSKQSTDGEFQLALLRALMTEPGSVLFDSITSTRTLQSIITSVSIQ